MTTVQGNVNRNRLTWENAPAEYWWLDVGPFKDRLGMDALAIASSDHRVCRAAMAMITDRKYIDLKGQQLASILHALRLAGQPEADPFFPGSGPITLEKIQAITAPPTTEAERHIKGLQQPA